MVVTCTGCYEGGVWSQTAPWSPRMLRLGTKPQQRTPLKKGSVGLQRRRTTRCLGDLGRLEGRLVELAVLGPPLLSGLGQRVDRVVVLVGPRQRLGVGRLDRGAVVL